MNAFANDQNQSFQFNSVLQGEGKGKTTMFKFCSEIKVGLPLIESFIFHCEQENSGRYQGHGLDVLTYTLQLVKGKY